MADDAVHVAVVHQRAGVAIVGAQDHVAGVEALFGDRGDLGFYVIPRRAEADHGAHALAHPCDGVLFTGAFVIVGGASRDISCKGGAKIGGGVVAADGFVCVLGGCHFGEHLGIGVTDTGEVHHLAQANDTGPVHRLGRVFGGDLEPGGFHAGRGRGAGGHLGEDVDRLHERFVVHHADPFEAEDVGDFVGVGEHGRGAVGDHGAGEFGGGEHAAFNVHMAITQAGDHIAVASVDDLGVRPFAMIGRGADKGDAACRDGDVMGRQDFAGVDIDPDAASDDRIRRRAACGGVHQLGSNFRP